MLYARGDSPRLGHQTARSAGPVRRGVGRHPARRKGRSGRPQRRRQVDHLPADHGRGVGRRRAGLDRSRRHHRLLQPGRGGDGRPQRGRRDHGRRGRGLGGRRRAARAGAGAGRSGPRRRARQAGRAVRRRPGPLRRAGRLRAGGPRPRDPGRPGFFAADAGRRRGRAIGWVEDAGGAGADFIDAPRRHAARRAVQPPRHRIDHLAGRVSQGLRRRAPHDLARSRIPEPGGRQDRRDRRRRADHVLGELRFLRAPAGRQRGAGRGAARPPAGHAGQGDALHRAVQGAGRQGRPGAIARQEARQDRAGRAAQAAQDAGLRVPAHQPLGRRRGQDPGVAQRLR